MLELCHISVRYICTITYVTCINLICIYLFEYFQQVRLYTCTGIMHCYVASRLAHRITVITLSGVCLFVDMSVRLSCSHTLELVVVTIYYQSHRRRHMCSSNTLVRAPPLGGCPIVITVCPSVCPSANFNIEYNFFTVRDRAFIFGMSVPYDKTLPTVP